MFTPKNILVPIDFSENSEKAFRDALDIAKKFESSVYILHAVNLVQQCAVDYCIDISAVERLENESVEKSKEALQKMIDKFPESKGLKFIIDVKKGHPYEEILKEQQDKKIDLIVMGSHSKKSVIGHFLGSIADKVSHSVKCPVLIMRE
jgi:nucleotide-binding universal stress UspA family protein